MSLISDDAVIVIGAGASVPFGAPDGLTLMDKIEATLKSEQIKLTQYASKSSFKSNLSGVSPIYWAWHKAGSTHEGYAIGAAEEFKELADWLSKQTSDSIDDVIRHNPMFAEKLKICIVYEMLQVTHVADEYGNYTPRNPGARLIGIKDNQRNWIHRLINVGRAALIKANDDQWPPEPKIRIVSFNYDGILEYVLSQKWDDVEGEFGNWTNVFEIYHPHGLIPILNDRIGAGKLVQYLRDNTAKIAVVYDTQIPPEIAESRAQAKRLCSEAVNIYAFGFAFAPSNCRLLGWDKPILVDSDDQGEQDYPTIRHVHYVNYGGSDGLKRRVADTFHPSERSDNEDGMPFVRAAVQLHPTEPLIGKSCVEITDALLNGFLGEMPA